VATLLTVAAGISPSFDSSPGLDSTDPQSDERSAPAGLADLPGATGFRLIRGDRLRRYRGLPGNSASVQDGRV
jgi:hypothetical protein